MNVDNPYKTLGVSSSATDAEIATAYRRLVRRWHPDRNPGLRQAEARTKAINVAYGQLKTPEVRRATDARLERENLAAVLRPPRTWQRAAPRPTTPRSLLDFAQILTQHMPPREALRVQLAARIGDLFINLMNSR